MKQTILLVLFAMLIESSAFAEETRSYECTDADVKAEDLALVMSILNKNKMKYVVTDPIRREADYNVIVRARSGFGPNINSKLIALYENPILVKRGIEFRRSVIGRCYHFRKLEDHSVL